jgi:hypothetical protein
VFLDSWRKQAKSLIQLAFHARSRIRPLKRACGKLRQDDRSTGSDPDATYAMLSVGTPM